MCLDTLAEFEVKKNVGYQVVIEWEKKYYSLYHGPFTPKKIGKWLKSTNKIISKEFQSYKSGFHVFLTREDARIFKRNKIAAAQPYGINEKYKIIRVVFRNVVATGYQNYRKVAVAKEIYITNEVR